MTQTSGGQPSEWWPDRFVTVARALVEQFDARIVFFGSAAESGRIEEMRSQLGADSISLAGETSLEDLGAYCSICDLLVTLDTGIMHVGRAVGVPMVVIAPAWQPAYEWLPKSVDPICLLRRSQIHCRHCRKFTCATRECMDEITSTEVISSAASLLSRFPPAETERESRLHRSTSPLTRTR